MDEQLLFELHITVDELHQDSLKSFTETCATMDGKALVIELKAGIHTTQPMLSKTYKSNSTKNALERAQLIGDSLKKDGFSPVRYKLEVDAKNGELLKRNGGYYEWHAKVHIEREEKLLHLCKQHGAHLSLNTLKNNHDTRFVTLREYGAFETFHKRLTELKDTLSSSGFNVTKQQHEYCVFDSKVTLDDGWLSPL